MKDIRNKQWILLRLVVLVFNIKLWFSVTADSDGDVDKL